MGSIHYTQIPFILVVISQSHLLPLLHLYSADPLVDLETQYGANAIVLFLCHDSHAHGSVKKMPTELVKTLSQNASIVGRNIGEHWVFTPTILVIL